MGGMIEQSLLKQNLKPTSDQGGHSLVFSNPGKVMPKMLCPLLYQNSSRTLGHRTYTNYHPGPLCMGPFLKSIRSYPPTSSSCLHLGSESPSIQ